MTTSGDTNRPRWRSPPCSGGMERANRMGGSGTSRQDDAGPAVIPVRSTSVPDPAAFAARLAARDAWFRHRRRVWRSTGSGSTSCGHDHAAQRLNRLRPMRECRGNLWRFHRDGAWIVVPTNGLVRRDGYAVMGRGVAAQAAQRFPTLQATLGGLLMSRGNHVIALPARGDSSRIPSKRGGWSARR